MLRTVAERPHVSANRFGARCCPVFSGRLPREFPENAIELRQGLKADCERDFADPQIGLEQQITRLFDSAPVDVADKILAGYFLEFFAQIIWTNFDCLSDFLQRKPLVRVLMDEAPRLPDLGWLGAVLARAAAATAAVFDALHVVRCACHAGVAGRPLSFAARGLRETPNGRRKLFSFRDPESRRARADRR